ncbi:unnamed protein product, partial [Heterotrigona itama]
RKRSFMHMQETREMVMVQSLYPVMQLLPTAIMLER